MRLYILTSELSCLNDVLGTISIVKCQRGIRQNNRGRRPSQPVGNLFYPNGPPPPSGDFSGGQGFNQGQGLRNDQGFNGQGFGNGGGGFGNGQGFNNGGFGNSQGFNNGGFGNGPGFGQPRPSGNMGSSWGSNNNNNQQWGREPERDIRDDWRRTTESNNKRTTLRTTSFRPTLQAPVAVEHNPPAGCNNCDVGPQFDPVCGSDGKTYRNEQLLRCISRCVRGNIKN